MDELTQLVLAGGRQTDGVVRVGDTVRRPLHARSEYVHAVLKHLATVGTPLPVDAAVARAYGRVYAGVRAAGRRARGARSLDLLIAATALAAELPLYTRNPNDFRGLEKLVEVVAVAPAR